MRQAFVYNTEPELSKNLDSGLMPTRKEHWNEVYEGTPTDRLGWYEELPGPSLDLINEVNISPKDRLLDAGAGATTLIDRLLSDGYENLVAVDISEVALRRLAERLDPEQAAKVGWIVGDLTDPDTLEGVDPVGLWHDRAVLHFLTEEEARQNYVRSLRSLVKPGGWVIVAAFSLDGAPRCSGLEVRNYDHRMIGDLLGPDFQLERHFDYVYHQPSGDARPYVYTLFQRTTRESA